MQIPLKRKQLDLPCWTMIQAICVSVDVSKYLDVLDCASSVLTCVQADTASAACPEHPGSLAMTSITFAAFICDADEHCSENPAQEPESSFTMSPRSTTLPLYFWY